jgi:hypothetical protein
MTENKPTATSIVRAYFEAHPNVDVWLPELRQALDETELYQSDEKVAATVNNLRSSRFGPGLRIVKSGQCWRYTPPGHGGALEMIQAVSKTTQKALRAAVGPRYQQIYETKQGAIILERDDGAVFLAKELDV